MPLMLPAAWLSLNTKNTGEKHPPSAAIGSLAFHLASYCVAKVNGKQAPTITAISQMPC